MNIYRLALILAGAAATAVISFGSTMAHGPGFIGGLEAQARAALDQAGARDVQADFSTEQGWMTRHPTLQGGKMLPPDVRARAAAIVAEVPGIGGVRWSAVPGGRLGSGAKTAPAPMHCQEDVEAILKARTIRFGEASAAIDPASNAVLNEVVEALRPCVGSIIAITGHTDAAGNEIDNIRLSRERAEAVRRALAGRGIPLAGLRSVGVGSSEPRPGLDPTDKANRRIDFSVISIAPLQPTPIDTPDAG